MIIEAWPFLVGRNKNLGYQTIVSPQFLSERGLSRLLAEAAGGDDTPSDTVIYRQILGTKAGDLTLFFRVVKASAQDYNLGGEEFLLDEGGRVIRLIEGFVVRHSQNSLQVAQYDLQKAHKLIKDVYYDFWQANEQFSERPSQPFELLATNHISTSAQISKPVQIDKDTPLDFRFWKPWRILVVIGLALVVLIPSSIIGYERFFPPFTPPSSRYLQNLCNDLPNNTSVAYDNAYNQLSSNVQSPQNKADFVAFFTSYPVKTCIFHQNKTAATITITYRKDQVLATISVTLTSAGKIDTNIIAKLQAQSR